MNRNIMKLGIALVVLYVALFAKLNWIQVVDKDSLDSNPLNTAQVRRDFNRPRGSIFTADGAVIAQTIANPATDSQFERMRVYPEGELFAQNSGYFSFRYGSSGIEKQYNDELSGSTFDQQVKSFGDLFVARENVGNLSISLRKDVQETARTQLGDREGSVVALDPRTGAILGLWSWPSYDPNTVSSLDKTIAETSWKTLNAAAGVPLRAHAYQDRYFPGSTFKVVTAGVGLQTGKVTNTEPSYPFTNGYTPADTNKAISNFGGSTCGGTLPEILRVSCNSSFAEMGAETIGPVDMVAGAGSFGFNSTVPIDMPEPAKSVFPTNVGNNQPKLAMSAIGQNDVQATPLQMAMVAGAVANGGVIMKPHVLSQIRNARGDVVSTYTPSKWLTPLSTSAAATLFDDMVGVVTNGTASGIALQGCTVGGKTGTAQLGTEPPKSHTWIIGFAGPPGKAPTVAVAVVVLNQSGGSEATGGRVAAPIAKAVLQTALAAQGGC
ncbi:MAG: penicillin-binding transpeptidase domain-containing protein [Acidimicrobiales bacterium]